MPERRTVLSAAASTLMLTAVSQPAVSADPAGPLQGKAALVTGAARSWCSCGSTSWAWVETWHSRVLPPASPPSIRPSSAAIRSHLQTVVCGRTSPGVDVVGIFGWSFPPEL
jgi:hypothetical protein